MTTALNTLLSSLSPHSTTSPEKLQAVADDPNAHLFLIREGDEIVATATLCVCHTPESTIGFVETVVVAPECRGKGYGRKIMEDVIAKAKDLGCDKLQLTSKPSRVAANELYKKLGFSLKETNCYKLEL